mgnify:CR=1 FL=1
MSNRTQELEYWDIDATGELDPGGKVRTLGSREAVEQALKLWVVSIRGEILRRPTKGGYITQWLYKPLSSDTAGRIQDSIRNGLRDDFPVKVRIKNIRVTPQYERSTYRVQLSIQVPIIQDIAEVDVDIRSLSGSPSIEDNE